MSKDGELVAKRMKCKHHREEVKKEYDKMLEQGRISQSLYNKCIEEIEKYI